MASQTGTFTAAFEATPNTAPMDGVMGFSSSPATSYTALATIVRFNSQGIIDARNGGAYQAATQIRYTAGVAYRFRLVIRIPSHTYDIYVTPAGGTEQVVGTSFAFRTEQNSVTSLSNWALFRASGTHKVCNVTVETLPDPAPVAEFNASPLSGTAPLTVNMHNAYSGTITSCTWDYGDGTSGTSCDADHNHTYTGAGSYTVNLTVSGPGGSNTKT